MCRSPAPERGCCIALRLPGVDVMWICTHLGRPKAIGRNSSNCSAISCGGAGDAPDRAGDFNDWRGKATASPNRRLLRGVRPRARQRCGPSGTVSAAATRPYLCATRRCTQSYLPRKPWSHLSDHAPRRGDQAIAQSRWSALDRRQPRRVAGKRRDLFPARVRGHPQRTARSHRRNLHPVRGQGRRALPRQRGGCAKRRG